MRVGILAVGRMRDGPERALLDQYLARLKGKNAFGPVTVKEVEAKRDLPTPERIEREGALLLAEIPKGATAVLLDERGKSLSSSAFASLLGDWRDNGVSDLVFLIGGADGHAEALKTRADRTLSFGAMTWPHLLVRALLAEQIYRAHAIQSGHPYHRE